MNPEYNHVEETTCAAAQVAAEFWKRNAPRLHEPCAPEGLQVLEAQVRKMFWDEMAKGGIFPPERLVPQAEIVLEDGFVPAGTKPEVLVYGWAGMPVLWGFRGYSTRKFAANYHRRPYGWGEYVPNEVWVYKTENGQWAVA